MTSDSEFLIFIFYLVGGWCDSFSLKQNKILVKKSNAGKLNPKDKSLNFINWIMVKKCLRLRCLFKGYVKLDRPKNIF